VNSIKEKIGFVIQFKAYFLVTDTLTPTTYPLWENNSSRFTCPWMARAIGIGDSLRW